MASEISENETTLKPVTPKPEKQDEQPLMGFLDNYGIKVVLDLLGKLKLVKITNSFKLEFIFFIFFFGFCWHERLLNLELSAPTIILVGDFFLFSCDLINSNLDSIIDFYNNSFNRDKKVENFFKRYPNMLPRDAEAEVRTLTFTPKAYQNFILSLKDTKNYSHRFISLVLERGRLTNSNLDLIFTPDILNRLDKPLICRLLFAYRNSITDANIQNTYETFKNDDEIVRMLIATNQSDYLPRAYKLDSLISYYHKFQKKKEHIDLVMKIIPINWLRRINIYSFYVLLFLSFILISSMEIGVVRIYGGSTFDMLGQAIGMVMGFFTFAFFITALISGFIIMPTTMKLYRLYYNRFLKNVSEV